MKDGRDWIHEYLDQESITGEPAAPGTPEAQLLKSYQETMSLLEESQEGAPEGFARRVLDALPESPEPLWFKGLRALWPARGRLWALPALAGAMAAFVVAIGFSQLERRLGSDLVPVTFEVHAPGAQRVELVGTFNEWKPGQILLKGPDATGHWTATVKLPAGLHEYVYLVDGREWMTDPKAEAYRPDGFGRQNALLQL